jgi:hypothetical protein
MRGEFLRKPNALAKTIRRDAYTSITAGGGPLTAALRETQIDLRHFRYDLNGPAGFAFFTLDGGEKRTSAQLRAEASLGRDVTKQSRCGLGVVNRAARGSAPLQTPDAPYGSGSTT